MTKFIGTFIRLSEQKVIDNKIDSNVCNRTHIDDIKPCLRQKKEYQPNSSIFQPFLLYIFTWLLWRFEKACRIHWFLSSWVSFNTNGRGEPFVVLDPANDHLPKSLVAYQWPNCLWCADSGFGQRAGPERSWIGNESVVCEAVVRAVYQWPSLICISYTDNSLLFGLMSNNIVTICEYTN